MSTFIGPYFGRSGIKAILGPAARRGTLRQLSSAASRLNSRRTFSLYVTSSRPITLTDTTSNALRRRLPRAPGIVAVRTLFSDRTVTEYIQLPPSYRDDVGLPFSKKDLDMEDVISIFGHNLSTQSANILLRILHGRRVAGTLDDPAYYHNTEQYSQNQINTALQYLRTIVPVDEVLNAGLRAEDELQRLEEEEADGASEGTPQPKDGQPSTTAEKWTRRLFKERPVDDPYGESALDRIRADREAKWEEELKRREAQRLQDEADAAAGKPGALAKIDKNAPRQPSAKMLARMKAAQSDLKEPPKMSPFARLWPSYVFVLAVLAGGTTFANYVYEPPPPSTFSILSAAQDTALALVLANVVVYCWWKTPALWPLMNRYFILTSATPRPLAMFGATISHQNFTHLIVNMPALFIFALALDKDVGRSQTLQLYAAGGSLGFLASLTHMVLRQRLHLATLGASGAIYALGGAYFWMYKFDGFKILGIPPDPYNGIQGLGFLGLALGGHLVALFGKKISQTDLVSHLAGMAVGVIYGEWFCMQKRERAAAYREGREERGLWELLVERMTTRDATPAKKPE